MNTNGLPTNWRGDPVAGIPPAPKREVPIYYDWRNWLDIKRGEEEVSTSEYGVALHYCDHYGDEPQVITPDAAENLAQALKLAARRSRIMAAEKAAHDG